eukprot:TRINITY_DN616_c1_g1_i5.p2 TRINITY_DN616_c1_g1~~TRINITY_DN616_c1_g1_i5.p2  ORF type:complete len:540 (-),score=157.95 TRINITY_DN616_c1_g1_i5:4397-6016(-)
MSFDPDLMPFFPALLHWLLVVGSLSGATILVSLLSMLSIHGSKGLSLFGDEVLGFGSDICSISIRRVAALAKLTFMEAYRRKALLVFVVFALLFMFAGWFMGNDGGQITKPQVKLYISFVLRAITWLTLPLMFILSSFGIPEEIRLRSLHTVVTKPARRLEVVLGRVLGFTFLGSLVLLVMSVVGWMWIVRQIPSEAKSMLICRVPIRGTLSFLDRNGAPVDKGINVGDINEFRSYIEGATKARAIWTFTGIDENSLDSDGNLHIENQFMAFRSYKGDMKRQLLFDYQFRNPEKNITYTTQAWPIEEKRGVTKMIPRKLEVPSEGKSYDLIKDFVTSDGKFIVEVSCIDREQYLGMARIDLFIRLPDQNFAVGFFKAVLGIEMIMILVVLIGVSASTFLKGPIATALTFILFVLSGEDTHKFMDQLIRGRGDKDGWQGGGFFESIYRIITHMNPTTDLPENIAFKFMQFVDSGLTFFLWNCKQVIPHLKYFNMQEYVANGFDVPFDQSLGPCLLITVGYVIPCVLLGFFALRIRELESK